MHELKARGVALEFETNLRRERQLKGIGAAKARGVYQGRKPSIDALEVRRLRREEKLRPTAWRNRSLPAGRALVSTGRLISVATHFYEAETRSQRGRSISAAPHAAV